MAVKFFRMPIEGNEALERDLNSLCSSRKIIRIVRELVQRESDPAWAICVEYIEGSIGTEKDGKNRSKVSKVDYREVLSEKDFVLFAKLRESRKALAEKAGVPVYAVFNNEQLADIAKTRPQSRTALGELTGIGDGKLEKFAQPILDLTQVEADGGLQGVTTQ